MNIGPSGEGFVLLKCWECARGSVGEDCQTESLDGGGEQDSNEEVVKGGLAAEVW